MRSVRIKYRHDSLALASKSVQLCKDRVPNVIGAPCENGIKGGTSYGTTDDFGHAVVENPVSVHDFHATILHQLGLHHQELYFERSGLEERLTGFEPPRVVHEILS